MDNTMVQDAAWVAGNQCAMCHTPIDKDEHLCSKCRREQVMDQERETYIDLLGRRKW